MESVVKKSKKFSSERDMNNRKVRVENFSGKEKVEDCEAFLKTFEKVVFVERIVSNKKSYGVYDVAFEAKIVIVPMNSSILRNLSIRKHC